MHSIHQSRRGISLAETVIATLLIGFVLVSTLQIVGPIVNSASVHADRIVAANLANELSEEIATKVWTSPILNDPESMGPGAGEDRTNYDDIDDITGWSSTPPTMSDGTKYTNLPRWTRSVTVAHVLTSDATTESVTSTGLKRVTVTVQKDGNTLATVTTLHSQAADTYGFIITAP